MKGFIRIKTEEVGKTIVLTADTPADILICNIEDENTDPATFVYDPETGEFTITSRCVATVTGMLFLFSGGEEVADLTINLVVNGVDEQMMYSGINNMRNFGEFMVGLEKNDVVKFTVTSPDDVTVETYDPQNWIMIRRVY